jgi:hypothetical protein
VSSVITIGFSGRTRACIRTEFTPPIADDERRETLVHVALMTARTFAALPPDMQLTLSGTLKEWIEDRFIACPTHLIPGDPMACLPRFASTFVAPVREYALASKGCNRNGRGIEFFLPMALVSFLRHVAVTYADPEDILKPALALCAAVVIQPLSMENHFQAAAASLPKVAPVVEKMAEEEPELVPEIARIPPVKEAPVERPPVVVDTFRPRRNRRRTLVLSACLAGLLIIAGVQYLSVHQPDIVPVPVRDIIPALPPKPSAPPPKVVSPTKPQGVETAPQGVEASKVEPPSMPPQSAKPMEQSELADRMRGTVIQEAPASTPRVAQEQAAKPTVPASSSPNIRAYQQQVREFAEDGLAQVEVMVGAIEGQILTQYELNDVLAYGFRQVRSDLMQVVQLARPETFEERHGEVQQVLTELARLAKGLTRARVQPEAEALQERLSNLQTRLEQALHAIDNL